MNLQLALGEAERRWETLQLPDASVRMCYSLFDRDTADRFFDRLLAEVPWRQDKIRMYGKSFDLPRLQQWFGDPGLSYVWSGIVMHPLPWTPTLLEIKSAVEDQAGETFNTVLLNRYRNGNDTVAWHADDEKDLGEEPTIASVTLGAERDFQLRHNTRADVEDRTIRLTHGSMLVMGGRTQHFWKHQVPRRKRVDGERINLTFRRIHTSP
jgi:alkylated DNA repair dioxygenase AlkB